MAAKRPEKPEKPTTAGVRIIGGRMRGRKIEYSGLILTRPMKDRVREALFSLLNYRFVDKFVIDLFAGTGALAFEAISRGAAAALLIEQHLPSCNNLRSTAKTLEITEVIQVLPADTLRWISRGPLLPVDRPWLVFCSPPYEMFVSDHDAMLGLLATLIERSPPGSVFVVEADDRFSFKELPLAEAWELRAYPPAYLGILEKQ